MSDIERFENEASRLDDYLSRAILLGNAGGVIATLTFIGTRISSGSADGFGVSLFFILVVYFVGMAMSWIYLVAELFAVGKIIAAAKGHKIPKHLVKLVEMLGDNRGYFFSAAGLLFIAASIGAFIHLWQLA